MNMYNINKFNIPNTKLYSKKQILEMAGNYIIEKYYSTVSDKYYNAVLVNNKCFAKQYPEKDLYYLTSTPN